MTKHRKSTADVLAYYDWDRTISYDADVTMVVGARDLGKTYGLRIRCIRDWINNHNTFVVIIRVKQHMSIVSREYFSKVGREFPEWDFKTEGYYGYIARHGEDSKKRTWHLLCYFLPLSMAQSAKQGTFMDVRRIVFDEFIIDRKDRYKRYLPTEVTDVINLLDTTSRERPGESSVRPHLYLLGNALDVTNPYFRYFGVPTNIEFGYRWFFDKMVLLHYVDSHEFNRAKREQTVAGRLLSRTDVGAANTDNRFVVGNDEFVERKTRRARFRFAIEFNGHTFGLWIDARRGCWYVSRKVSRGQGPTYYLTTADMQVNAIALRSSDPQLCLLRDGYYAGFLRYEDRVLKAEFVDMLQRIGVH